MIEKRYSIAGALAGAALGGVLAAALADSIGALEGAVIGGVLGATVGRFLPATNNQQKVVFPTGREVDLKATNLRRDRKQDENGQSSTHRALLCPVLRATDSLCLSSFGD